MDGQHSRSAWTHERVVEIITSIDTLSAWPDAARLLKRPLTLGVKPSWEYVCHACSAVGSPWEDGLSGAAAVLCLHYSIHLVDDVLDEDPLGLQKDLGFGPVFNIATAFQAAAGMCLHGASVSAGALADMHAELHSTVLATGWGQYLDSQDLAGEEGYWRTVRAKTPPLFSCALFLGARSAGCDSERARSLARLGVHLGEIAQVNDDLGDALECPACPDWNRAWGNLPILYGRVADHPERETFRRLADQVARDPADDQALRQAQEILLRSGAVSYCVHCLSQAYSKGMELLATLKLESPDQLRTLFDYQLRPLKSLLSRLDIDFEPELAGLRL